MQLRSVGICLKDDQPQAEGTVMSLVSWLGDRSIGVLAVSYTHLTLPTNREV